MIKLRHALACVLGLGVVGSLYLGFDLLQRMRMAAADLVSGESALGFLTAMGTPFLLILGAIAMGNLGALLLLAAVFREERTRVLLRAQATAGVPPLGSVIRAAGAEAAAVPDAGEGLRSAGPQGPGAGGAAAPAWRNGRIVAWEARYGGDVHGLWNRCCRELYRGFPKDLDRFEKLYASPEFDHEASAVALRGEGELCGAVLALRQPAFEDDGYWWLESPLVVTALLVEPEWRNRGAGRALMQQVEAQAVKRRCPRIFVGGLENLPHLVPGVPHGDEPTRLFFVSMGYIEVRRTRHMEADFLDFTPPRELLEREQSLLAKGYAFRSAQASDQALFDGFLEVSNLDRKQRRSEKFAINHGLYYFALYENRVVGFIQVTPREDDGRSGIHLIYFLRPHRGSGLGSVMLLKAHELWRAMGAKGGSIWTYPEAAERFYPRAGFKVVQEWACFEKELPHAWGDPAFVNRFR